jgi:hypothetical protein
VASRDSLANPSALDDFVALAARRGGGGSVVVVEESL